MLHLRVLEVLSVDRFMARSVIVSSETERPGCGGFFKGPLMSIVSPLGLIYDRRGSCEVADRPVVSAAPVANRYRYSIAPATRRAMCLTRAFQTSMPGQ